MEIKRLKNAKFGTKELHVVVTGWAFYVKGKGYVAYSSNRDKYGILAPYIPCGGKRALQAILNAGGFTSFEGMEYVKELYLNCRDLWYNEKKKRQRGFCMRIAEARKLKEGDVVITPHGFPLMVCSISEFNSPLGRNTIVYVKGKTDNGDLMKFSHKELKLEESHENR